MEYPNHSHKQGKTRQQNILLNRQGEKMSNEKLKEKCELIIKIIDALKEAEKGELNDIYQEFDTAKEDLKNILGFEDSENE